MLTHFIIREKETKKYIEIFENNVSKTNFFFSCISLNFHSNFNLLNSVKKASNQDLRRLKHSNRPNTRDDLEIVVKILNFEPPSVKRLPYP